MSDVTENHIWGQDPIYEKVQDIASKSNLHFMHRKGLKYKYTNFCWSSSKRSVEVQYHKRFQNEAVLVIGKADGKCPIPNFLEKIEYFEGLSGDWGSNCAWLRAEGKTFGHLSPARGFILPKTLDAPKQWDEVEELIKYAAERKKR